MKFNNISWDEYFMSIAVLSSLRSKDPNTKVGACIISEDHKVLSLGYNGMPIGIDDNCIPWKSHADGETEFLKTKYPYVCHAELNAILNSNHDLHGAAVYVTLFPCNECTKAIIQSGIKKIIYISDKYHDTDEEVAARKMLDMAGIEYVKYEGRLPEINF
ncbi:MAG: dCMP deaminase family protein [Bacilli bacterium]